MRKISSLLKGAAVTAMLLCSATGAFAYPPSIMGDYTYTGEVTYAPGVSDAMKAALPATFEFNINVRNQWSEEPKLFDFINSDFNTNISYDSSTGVITQVGFPGVSYVDDTNIVMKDASGTGDYDDYRFSWTVNEAGVISIPTFTICSYSGDLIATFANGVAKPAGAVDPEPDPDPTPGGTYPPSIMGDYTYTGEVTYASGVSDAMKAALPATFEFNINVRNQWSEEPKLFDFINSDFNTNISYDSSTGVITQVGFPGMSYVDETNIVMKDASGTGEYDDYRFSWTVNEAGVISIPTFTICSYSGDLIATFANGVAKPAGAVDPEPDPDPTPGPGEDDGTHPENILGDYTFKGTVTYGAKATAEMQAALPESFKFVINMSDEFNPKVQITQFLFAEEPVKVTYNSTTGIITPNYGQEFTGHLPGNDYIIKMGNADGDPDDYTFEWTVDSKGNITIPTFTVCDILGNVYATYTGGVASIVEELPVTIVGQYSFSGTVEYAANTAPETQAVLPAAFDFEINMSDEFNPKTQISNFLFFEEPVKVTYNSSTGAITNNAYQYFSYFGVPGVQYMVVLGDATGENYGSDYNFEWTVDTKGNITLPTFTVCDFVGNVLATYKNGVATLTSGGNQGGDDGKPHDFLGLHTTKNWWIANYTTYDDNIHYSVTSGHDIDIVINENNQYTNIAGLTVDPSMIEYGYNQGTVKGNVWSIDLNNFGNVITRESEENPSGYVLSGPVVPKDLQPDTQATLTLTYNSTDDTYTLSDFTIWYKTVEGSDDKTTTTWKVLYRYSTSEILPYTPEDDEPKAIEGNWTFTLFDHYQGSESLGKVDVAYEASVSGNTVTFEDPTDTYPMIVAELTSDDTLTFKYAKASNLTATYSLYQQPYINSDGTDEIEDLTEEEFTAVFNAETGTLTFPANSGLRYGFFNAAGDLSYWSDAFDLIEAVNTDINSAAKIALSGVDYPATVDNGEFYVNFRYTTTNVPAGSTLTAYLKDADGNFNSELELTGSPVYWNLQGIAEGAYNFTLYIQATDAAGNVIATSNSEAFQTSVTVGIDGINSDAQPARYFNLQGVEVTKPENGVFIRIQGDKAVKVIK